MIILSAIIIKILLFYFKENKNDGVVPKVMSVALIELVEMPATLNVVVSINSTTVMQAYWSPHSHKVSQSDFIPFIRPKGWSIQPSA